jgi:hypothetical protein
LKDAIEAVKSEKNHYQQQLINIRKELANLQSQYESGQPIVALIEQAKTLLLAYQTEQKERQTSQNQIIITEATKYVRAGAAELAVSVPPSPSGGGQAPSFGSPSGDNNSLAPRPPAMAVGASPRAGNTLKSPAASVRAKKSPSSGGKSEGEISKSPR